MVIHCEGLAASTATATAAATTATTSAVRILGASIHIGAHHRADRFIPRRNAAMLA